MCKLIYASRPRLRQSLLINNISYDGKHSVHIRSDLKNFKTTKPMFYMLYRYKLKIIII